VTTWDGAYHWHTDKSISAVDAIKLRENGRKESGDYWCHKSCHIRQPRDGIEIYPRNHPTTPHFWKGSGNFTKINDCTFYQLQIERKESSRYSQFYHDLRSWLDTDEAKQILSFSTFSENKAHKYSDFILVATTSEDVTWTKMEIVIVHKNRKRVPQTNNHIRIDLSQWTIKQILNFEGYGKRKIIEEFNQLIYSSSQDLESDSIFDTYSSFKEALEGEGGTYGVGSHYHSMRNYYLLNIAPTIDKFKREAELLEKYLNNNSNEDFLVSSELSISWDNLGWRLRKWKSREVTYTVVKKVRSGRGGDGFFLEFCNDLAKKWANLNSIKIQKNGVLKISIVINNYTDRTWKGRFGEVFSDEIRRKLGKDNF